MIALLLKDRSVRLYLVLVSGLSASFILPILTDAQRAMLGDRYLAPLCMACAILACFDGIGRVRDPEQRRIWGLFGIGLALWEAALLLYLVDPTIHRSDRWEAASDTLFLLFYVPVALALARDPLHDSRSSPGERAPRFETAGLACLGAGWITYAIVLPAISRVPYGEFLENWAVYPVLDLLVLGRLGVLLGRCRVPSWRVLYRSLLVAGSLTALSDSLDVLLGAGVWEWQPSTPQPLLWMLPSAGFVMAARWHRHVGPDPAVEPVDSNGWPVDDEIWAGSLLLVGASSLPLTHLVLSIWGTVPDDIARAQALTVLCAMCALGGLAVGAFRAHDARRDRMQRERQDLETRIVQAQKMEAVGRLAGGIAHDFNNLLTAIGGYCDLAADMAGTGHAASRALREVRKATDRAATLTRRLLTLGGRLLPAQASVDLNDSLRDLEGPIVQLLGPRIALRMELAPDLWTANGEAGQIEQVVLNLAVNARDAMAAGGALTMATANVDLAEREARAWSGVEPGSYVRLCVTDTGVGIAKDIQGHIFDPFFTTKPGGQGTGLGLAIVSAIVRQSGGAIAVQSAPGQGTTFEILLPRGAREGSRQADTARPPAGVGTETILLAEDEESVRELARTMLERIGYTVLVATDGADAIRISRQQEGPIDLLLTDVVMPGLNGHDLAVRLSAERPGLRVLFTSGYTGDTVLRWGVSTGELVLLPKPFTQAALASAVRQVLDRGRESGEDAWHHRPSPGGAAAS